MEIKSGYIRVTELLKPWTSFGNIPMEIIDAKAQIGSNVHEAINMSVMGLPLPKLTEREQKYFDSYLKWEELEEPKYECTEQRYYDEDLKVTGQIDAIITLPGRDVGRILDFKCSAKADPLKWHIQLGWYFLLAQKNKLSVSETGSILQLKDNGSPAKLHQFVITNGIIGVCKSLYESYVYFNPQVSVHFSDHKSWCC